MKTQKGFTLIELMVVIVIIGILSALGIPKMFGISAKAKAAEAPTAIANYETLQSAYYQEAGAVGLGADIGYVSGTSKWYTYNVATAGTISAATMAAFGACATAATWTSVYVPATDTFTHTKPAGQCGAYTPNF